jgi:hypothetical protein
MKVLAIIISLSVIVLYASFIQSNFASGKEELKFSTDKVRSIWQICSNQFQTLAPNIPQLERIRLCDCYVDHMRSTFTPKQVEALSLEQTKELGKKMNIICPVQIPFTIKEFT